MDKFRMTGLSFIKTNIIAIASFIIALLCILYPVCDGLEFLFLLPLSFGLSTFIFPSAHSYWKANIGFIIIFASMWVKYLVTPALMTISHSTVDTLNPSPAAFRLSSFVAVFELFVTLFIIQHLWQRHLKKTGIDLKDGNKSPLITDNGPTHADFRLSWTGFLFIAVLIILVVARGRLLESLAQLSTWFRASVSTGEVNSYDLIAFEIIRTGVIIVGVSFFAKLYYKQKNKFLKAVLFILAFAVATLNTTFFRFEQRTALAQLIFATMFMFFSFFPKQKRTIIPVSVVVGGGLVAAIFLEGTLHYSFGDTVSDNMLVELSKMSELYVSGPTVVAETIDTIPVVAPLVTVRTVISDIINSMNFLSTIPFTRWIPALIANVPTSNDLFKDAIGGYTYILPNFSYASYYVSEFLGWALETFFIWASVRLICFVEKKKNQNNDALFYYAFTYFEIILGQSIFINNFRLLWHAFTVLPIWLLVFAVINKIGYKIKFKR